MNGKAKRLLFLIILFLSVILLPVIRRIFSYAYDDMFYVCGVLIISIAIIALYYLFKKQAILYELNSVDILMGLFLIYIIFNYCFTYADYFNYVLILKGIIIFGTYVLLRMISRFEKVEDIFQYIVVLVGVIEVTFMGLQWFSIIDPNNQFFTLTGSYSNPAPLGGILLFSALCCLFIVLNFFRGNGATKLFYLYTLVFVVLMIGLFASGSRSGIIVFLGSMSIVLVKYILRKVRIRKTIVITIGILISILLVVVIVSHINIYEEPRLLIWTVSSKLFLDNPIFGGGLTSFTSHYPYYQADFFINNPTSEFSKISGDNYQPYNFIIGLICELGIAGFILFIAVMYLIFRKGENFELKLILFSILSFMLFNNMFDSLAIVILLMSAIAILSTNSNIRKYEFKLNNKIIGLFILPLLAIGIYTFHIKSKFDKTVFSLQQFTVGNQEYFKDIDEDMVFSYRPFTISYYEAVYNNMSPQEANIAFSRVLKNMATVRLVTLQGDLYSEMNNTTEAEKYYLLAENMVPSRIIPSYKLFLLYKDTGQNDEALREAMKILDKEVSVVSSVTLRIRAEVREYIFKYSRQI